MAPGASPVGRTISHYRVLEEIGAGGMGVVYRAHDERLDRDVALKVLPAGTLSDDAARRQFRREALALAKLNHPNIATIFDFDTRDDLDFLAMELIIGEPLNKKLMEGPLSEPEIQRLGKQFAEGLAAAHDQGVIHRDLKPGNLLVTPDGRLKILDFGLAKLRRPEVNPDLTQSMETTTGSFSGTVPYMPPEQLRGQEVDPRSDIYGAGAVLYEMATGHRPFPQRQSAELMAAILHEAPASARSVNRRVSSNLDSVITKALEKDPSRRYQSARELQAALEKLGEGTAKSSSSARLYAAGGMLAAVLLIAIVVTVKSRGLAGSVASPSTSPGSNTSAVTPRKANVPSRRSVAVLGFRNVSGRPDEAWVSTALSEMLTTELAAGERLRTVSGENVARMKADLSLPEADSYAADTLGKMRQTVGADYFVLGSYVPTGKPSEKKLRIDLRLEDASAGQIAAAVSESGSVEDLDALVNRAGVDLRRKLGVEDISPLDTKMLKAALPADSEAARLYSEGLAKARAYDLQGGRDLLKKAVLADPSFPSAHAALAGVLSGMGYDEEARKEAKKAFELSANANRETHLSIEALYRKMNHETPKAIEIYRTLFSFFPDNLDYGIQLAESLRLSGKGKESLEVIDGLKTMSDPFGNSPRVDLQEAQAAGAIGDFKREVEAALRAEKAGRAQGRRTLTARALGFQAAGYQMTGQHQQAIVAATQELEIYSAAGDTLGKALALGHLAEPLKSTGDPTAAAKAEQQAVDILRRIGSQRNLGVDLNNLASLQFALGDPNSAIRSWNEELRISREIGDKEGIAASHVNLGSAHFVMGDLSAARQSFEQAMVEYQAIGYKRGALESRENLAEAQALLGDLGEAERNSQQVLRGVRESGDKTTEGVALAALGRISEKRGDLAEARRRYSDALSLRNSISEKTTAAESSLELADLTIEEGQPEKATPLIAAAKAEFQKEKLADDELSADTALAKALLAMGKPADALAQLDTAKNLAAQAQDRAARFAFDTARGRALGLTGKYSEGTAELRLALRQAHSAGFALQAFEARLALGELDLAAGKKAEARAELAALKADATAKGFLLVARKASAMLQPAGS